MLSGFVVCVCINSLASVGFVCPPTGILVASLRYRSAGNFFFETSLKKETKETKDKKDREAKKRMKEKDGE